MSDKWSDIRVGTLITGFETICSSYHDNLIVTACGHDWALVRDRGTSRVVGCVLEPEDDYKIGEHEYDESDGSLYLVNSTV